MCEYRPFPIKSAVGLYGWDMSKKKRIYRASKNDYGQFELFQTQFL